MSNNFDRDNIFSDIMQEDAEFIPIISSDDDTEFNLDNVPEELPILPLRNMVLFPGVIIPITVGREKSTRLVNEVYRGDRILGTVSQIDVNVEDPDYADLNQIGTVAKLLKVLQMPDGTTTVIVQGKQRFRLDALLSTDPYLKGQVTAIENVNEVPKSKTFHALMGSLKDMALQIVKSSNIPNEVSFAIKNIENPVQLVNVICTHLQLNTGEKQELLEVESIEERATNVLKSLSMELQMIDLKNQIQKKVKTDLDKQQRDYLLNQQIKTIQEELGSNPAEVEINELKKKAKKKKWSGEVQEVFDKELAKLQRMNPAVAEYSIQLNYMEVLVELPWNESTKDNFDLKRAQKILDQDHFGLEQVKDRIIEYLAVLKLKGDMKSPIICLVGPPGVGKTSLGKSIAKALGRKYIRMSLGGLRDEAEIRGHRKTYIGAMPGRIIQNLRKAKSSNPVFVLDEIDKVAASSANGDPASALLEVLDPEQNTTFYDNFLEVEYDLSKVMFVATANTLSTIHPALRDRMEIIDVSGYLMEEKVEIAKRHLIPKQIREHGFKKTNISFTKDVIQKLIEDYTRESGVRTLDKNLAKIVRNKARDFVMDEENYNKRINNEGLLKIMGAPRFQRDKSEDNHLAGVVTGLAWTAVGGEILFIEVSLSPGKGGLTLTGNLGDVMKESAALAYEYLKSNSDILDLKPEVFQKWNVHVHVPEGATPKDGPSAGITMFTALASAFTQRKVKTRIAMTGEITLRGKVLPVGGIKEKILAAKRANITDICLSIENKKDIEEIKPEYIQGVNFH
ncbi:MAG: endopeptidase La, partial [Bacteroidales bacterium]|nr:endopeptidase La [Bacteroidales bacterium]